MSNVNNWKFAQNLDKFKVNVLDVQQKKVLEAEAIMNDANYQWKDDKQKQAGIKQLEVYRAWLLFYKVHYESAMELINQHENLVNKMSKVYDRWYSDISNDGKQETEIMSMQADLMCELMGEIYKELLPLNLPGMKAPKGLNL